MEREIINHRLLAHPHIVGFKEVFVTLKVGLGGWRRSGALPAGGHSPSKAVGAARVRRRAVPSQVPTASRPAMPA